EHEAEHSHEQEHSHSHEQGHAHSHAHSSLREIADIVRSLAIPEEVREDVLAVYGLIAEAESHVHGVPVTDIHFHEVGTLDAVADITAVCLLVRELAPERIVASAVHVGSGQVRCAHGTLPVPAPATAYLLRGVPVYGGSVKGELCTPTGAALLRHFVSRFGEMPPMRLEAIGYGMGKKDFEAANCVRALLGESEEGAETVCELCCNLDDMTGEAVGYAEERFFEAGALDVYTVPIGMKKSRPGVRLCVLCREADKERMLRLFFLHTTTLGVRERTELRHVLSRKTETVSTPWGEARRKQASGYGVTRSKWEYDDLARIAGELGCGLAEAREKIERNE
ncbi:MAG: nickel pincer cofactor biosynthesis protein LarC, partial [Lachnospiraceae bacterium]|nr:nickel pincer cofactor biosynthesis protein LarC [Lachnospiraceae bacterium]